jgi:hypothetical protein
MKREMRPTIDTSPLPLGIVEIDRRLDSQIPSTSKTAHKLTPSAHIATLGSRWTETADEALPSPSSGSVHAVQSRLMGIISVGFSSSEGRKHWFSTFVFEESEQGGRYIDINSHYRYIASD